jgi:transcriptional regulator with XRE-family HTH domain
MDIYTPVKEYVAGCTGKDLQALADKSGVPFTTIMKIKTGETKNPGVITVQKLYPHLPNVVGERRRAPGRRETDKQIGRRTRKANP